MQLLNRRLYNAGQTYKGAGVLEQDHLEYLQTYSVNGAEKDIFSTIERVMLENGHTLLRTDIYYEKGMLYHLFDVNYYYIHSEQLRTQRLGLSDQHNNTQEIHTLPIPAFLIPLLPAILSILYAIVVGIIVYAIMKTIKEIIYGPENKTTNTSNILMLAILLFGGTYLLSTLVQTSQEARK